MNEIEFQKTKNFFQINNAPKRHFTRFHRIQESENLNLFGNRKYRYNFENHSIIKPNESLASTFNGEIPNKLKIQKSNKKNIINLIVFKIILNTVILLNTINLILRTYSYITLCTFFDYSFLILIGIIITIKIKTSYSSKTLNNYFSNPITIINYILVFSSLLNIILNICLNMRNKKAFYIIYKNYCNLSEFLLFNILLVLYQNKLSRKISFLLSKTPQILSNLKSSALFLLFVYIFFSFLALILWKKKYHHVCQESNSNFTKNVFSNTLCGGENTCNNHTELCIYSDNSDLYDSVYFNYDITKFNNFYDSILNVILFSNSGSGWIKIMNLIMNGHSYIVSYIYFLIFEVIYNFIFNNLIIIIIFYTFQSFLISSNENEEIKKKNKLLTDKYNEIKYKKQYPIMNKCKIETVNQIENILNYVKTNTKTCNLFYFYPRKYSLHKKCFISYIAYILYYQYIIQFIFYANIILNLIILSLENKILIKEKEHYILNNNKNSNSFIIMLKIKFAIVIIYIIEHFLNILGNGIKVFKFKNLFYIFDLCISGLCVLIYFLSYYKTNIIDNMNNPSILFGAFRIIKFIELGNISLKTFKITIINVIKLLVSIIYFIPIILIFLISYSILGYYFFHGSLKYDNFMQFSQNASNYENNFDNFLNSLLTTLIILLKDHWDDLFYLCYRSDLNYKILTVIYFISFIIIGRLLIVNFFIAYLLTYFDLAQNEIELNSSIRLLLINSQLNSTQLYQLEKLKEKLTKYQIKKNIRKYNNIIRINLFKNNRRLVAYNNELALTGASKINFPYNTVKKNENFYFLHSNNFSEYHKEILLNDIINNDFILRKERKANLNKKISFYHFNVNYLYQNIDDSFKNKKNKNKSMDEIFNIDYMKEKIENVLKFNNNSIELSSECSEFSIKKLFNNKNRKSTINMKNAKNPLGKRFSLISNLNINSNPLSPKKKIQRRNSVCDSRISLKKTSIVKSFSEKSKKIEINKVILNLKNKKPLLLKNEENKPLVNNINIEYIEEISLCEKINSYCKNSSLFIFHQDSDLRLFCKKITSFIEFDYTMDFFILVNSIALCIKNRWLDTNSSLFKRLEKIDFIMSIIFIFEGLLKIISDGFIWKLSAGDEGDLKSHFLREIKKEFIKHINQKFDEMTNNQKNNILKNCTKKVKNRTSYLLNILNIIDFCFILLSIFDLFIIYNFNISQFWRNVVICLRCMTPLRLIIRIPMTSKIKDYLLKSFKILVIIFTIIVIYLIFFGILSQYFFGKENNILLCLSGFKILNNNAKECNNSQNGKKINDIFKLYNFLNSLKIIFVVMLGENWYNIMNQINQFSVYNSFVKVFFVFCVLIGKCFLIKLIICVFIESYKQVSEKEKQYENLTIPEIEWTELQIQLTKKKPIKKNFNFINDKKRLFIKKIVSSKWYKILRKILIAVNILIALIHYNNFESDIFLKIFDYIYYIISLTFNIEILFDSFLQGFEYLLNVWNLYDLVIIILNDIIVFLHIFLDQAKSIVNKSEKIKFSKRLSHFLEIVRIMRFISLFDNNIKEGIIIFFNVIINVFNPTFFIVLVIMVIYADIGVNLFGMLPHREFITSTNNFNNFFSSFMILIEVLTGGDWDKLMNEAAYHDCKNNTTSSYLNNYFCINYNIICYDNAYIDYSYIDYFNSHSEEFKINGSYLNYDIYKDQNAYHMSCGNNISYFYFISFIVITSLVMLNSCIVFILEGYYISMKNKKYEKKAEFRKKLLKLWSIYDIGNKLLVSPEELILILKELSPPVGINYDRDIKNNPLKYQRRLNQFRLFKQYLENRDSIKSSNKIIQYDDKQINEKYNEFPYAYQFSNLYISKNKNFFTYDYEILHILNYLKLFNTEDKTGIIITDQNSYKFENKLITKNFSNENKNNFYIHYVDACIALSKYITARREGVDINSLRENFVNSYTINKWMTNFNSNEVIELFNLKKTLNEEGTMNLIAYKLSNNFMSNVSELYVKKMKEYFDTINSSEKAESIKENNKSIKGKKISDKRKKQNDEKFIKIFHRSNIRCSRILIPVSSTFFKRLDKEIENKKKLLQNKEKLTVVQKCQFGFN